MQTEGGGFRMTRDRQTDEFPVWHESAAPKAPAEGAPAQSEATPAEEAAVPAAEQAADQSAQNRASLPDRRRRSKRS